MNFSKKDRVIVNLGSKKKPSYYLGTVSKVKPITVLFDDGDTIKFDDFENFRPGVDKKYKKEISEYELHNYVTDLSFTPEPEFQFKPGDNRLPPLKLGEISKAGAMKISPEFVKDPNARKFYVGNLNLRVKDTVLFVDDETFYIGRISLVNSDYIGDPKVRVSTGKFSVRINTCYPIGNVSILKEKPEESVEKPVQKVLTKIKVGKEYFKGYEVLNGGKKEIMFKDKRFDLGDTITIPYKGKDHECSITKIQVVKKFGMDCWRYNFQAGYLKGWFLDMTKNGKPQH